MTIRQTAKDPAFPGQSVYTSCPPYSISGVLSQAMSLQTHTEETIPTATSDFVTCTYSAGVYCTYSAQCGNLIANPDNSFPNGGGCAAYNLADNALRANSGEPIQRRSIRHRSIRNLQVRADDLRRLQRA